MSVNSDRLEVLLDRHKTGSCTELERVELYGLLEDSWEEIEFGRKAEHVDWERMYRELLQGEVNSFQEKHVLPVRRIQKWRRWVAVAAVLLIMVAGYWMLAPRREAGDRRLEENPIVDIAPPDKTKARITLADGRTISLDSLTSITQGDVQISKTNDGRIVYSSESGVQSQVQYNTLMNPRGSKVIDIQLSDGSHVWLNAGSSITYPVAFIGDERRVSMTGEAYFEVASRESVVGSRKTPFIVEKEGMQVTVLGTKFNVNAYDEENEIRVTLLEGSVKVSSTNSTSSIQNSTFLKPGQQAVVSTNEEVEIVNAVDLVATLAWKNGKFDFGESMDLRMIMRQISRWYNVDIVYEGSGEQSFGGSISRQVNVSKVLEKFELTGKVKFRIEGSKITVIKK